MQTLLEPASAKPPARGKPRFGLDLYSLRSQPWSPFEFLDFAANHGVEVVHFSEARWLGGLDEANLVRVRSYAQDRGIELEVGMGSICESSTWFAHDQGPAADQLHRMLDVAHQLGSPIVRCYQGSSEDRPGDARGVALAPQSPLPFVQHIANTLATLRAVRTHALDLGLHVAIENHAGGLHSHQLRALIEEAGPDFVGAVLDAGNAMWTLETPMIALEALAPHVLTSHVRDSALWEVPEGVMVQWCPLGKGNAGIAALAERYAALCPGRAFTLEVINVPEPRLFRYHDPGFWDAYGDVPAWTFAAWLEIARNGAQYQGLPAPAPAATDDSEHAKDRIERDSVLIEREQLDVEDAIRFAKEVLQLGSN